MQDWHLQLPASGLLELSSLIENERQKAVYLDIAERILIELGSARYLTQGLDTPALLLHCVGSKPGHSEVDMPIIYGDYYFVEALMRYRAR